MGSMERTACCIVKTHKLYFENRNQFALFVIFFLYDRMTALLHACFSEKETLNHIKGLT